MAVRFQLIFNGSLDSKTNLIDIMPTVADVLEIDMQFVGSYFNGKPVILTESEQFKPIQLKQKQLENIGLYCDIKPVTEDGDTIVPEQTSSIRLSKELHYKSTFKTPDTDQHNLIELSKDTMSAKKNLSPLDMKFDNALHSKVKTNADKVEEKNSSSETDDDLKIDYGDQWKD